MPRALEGTGALVRAVERVSAFGVRVVQAQARQNRNLLRLHRLGVFLAGFVVPALGMQRAVHQQVGVVLGQGFAEFFGFARTTGAHSTRSAITTGAPL